MDGQGLEVSGGHDPIQLAAARSVLGSGQILQYDQSGFSEAWQASGPASVRLARAKGLAHTRHSRHPLASLSPSSHVWEVVESLGFVHQAFDQDTFSQCGRTDKSGKHGPKHARFIMKRRLLG